MKHNKSVLITCSDLQIGGMQKSLIQFISYLKSNFYFDIELMIWGEGELLKMLPDGISIRLQKYPPTLKDLKIEESIGGKIKLFLKYIKFKYFNRIIKKPWLYYNKIKKNFDYVIAYSHKGFPMFFAIDNVTATQKFLWFHHGSYENSESLLNPKYFKQFTKIIPVSESNQDELIHHFPFLKEKMYVIPNIINVESIANKAKDYVIQDKKDLNKVYFCTVSRFSPEKGLDLAVRIAAELKRRNVTFEWFFVGDGESFLEVKNLARELQVQDECVFIGSKTNPYPYIDFADIYIQTSFIEAHPLTINEALVLKKYIVATDLPAVRKVLQDGKLGILSTSKPDTFADKTMELINNDEISKMIKMNVKNHVVSNQVAYNRINTIFSEHKE